MRTYRRLPKHADATSNPDPTLPCASPWAICAAWCTSVRDWATSVSAARGGVVSDDGPVSVDDAEEEEEEEVEEEEEEVEEEEEEDEAEDEEEEESAAWVSALPASSDGPSVEKTTSPASAVVAAVECEPLWGGCLGSVMTPRAERTAPTIAVVIAAELPRPVFRTMGRPISSGGKKERDD